MRRITATALALLVTGGLLLAPDAHGTPPPGYSEARAAIVHEGRAVDRLVAAGDAAALHSRFTPAYARELPETSLRELLERVLAAGSIGERRGESALPVARDRRTYVADHAHAGGLLALELVLDARGRIASLGLHPRTPLPPDPGAGRDVELRLPVKGTWWVWWGGTDERQNYHAVYPDQRHAYDLVKWRRGGTARGRGIHNRDYFAFGSPVVAPAAGMVVEARDGVRDNRPQVELENPADVAGNHVVLALGPGRYVLLAHFKQGSVRVHSGQQVRAGQLLGRVGNSGNSSEPHLHVHAQDTPTLFAGTGLPIVFGKAAPVQGQFIAPGPVARPAPRRADRQPRPGG